MLKVSVITTLYNYRNYIGDCIQSFLDQKFEDAEMIIVDDASTDNPYEVIKKYTDKRVKYIPLKKNGNYSHAKNVGIKASDSDVLVMLDADDMLTKNGIKVRYKKLMKGYDFVHGPCFNFKKGKPLVRNRIWDNWVKYKTYKYVHAQGVMLKKDIHSKIGLYDENLRSKSDREMFARIFHHRFKTSFVKTPVAIYRIHSKQMHKSKEKLRINDHLQKQVLKIMKRRKKDLSDLEMLI